MEFFFYIHALVRSFIREVRKWRKRFARGFASREILLNLFAKAARTRTYLCVSRVYARACCVHAT